MTIDGRLDRLEHQLARMKWFNRILLAALATTGWAWLTVAEVTGQPNTVPDEVRARAFVLEDDRGSEVADLDSIVGGGASLTLGSQGLSSTRLLASKEGASIEMRDARGEMQVDVGTNTGQPVVRLWAGSGKPRVAIMALPQGPVVLLLDDSQGIRAELSFKDKDGSGMLTFFDANQKGRVALGALTGSSVPSLLLSDANAIPRAGLTVENTLGASLVLFDANKTPRAHLATGLNNGPSLTLRDANGASFWATPMPR